MLPLLWEQPPFLLPPKLHPHPCCELWAACPPCWGSPGLLHCWEVPDDTCLQMESRRITHISAEQKRRFNIKLGFDTLHSLVSTLSAQPSIKVSTQSCADRPRAHGDTVCHPGMLCPWAALAGGAGG